MATGVWVSIVADLVAIALCVVGFRRTNWRFCAVGSMVATIGAVASLLEVVR